MTGALWRQFDDAWYLGAYPDAAAWLAAGEFASAEDAYIARGAGLGHAPNPFFHERWYLNRYPPVREAVNARETASGFEHFCLHGHQDLMPHWLFDPGFYRDLFQQAFGRAFQPAAEGDPYDHFLRIGQYRGLSGHWLFDPAVYAARAPHDVAMRIRRDGPFTTFLLQMAAGGAEPVTSNLFDPDWYRACYPGVAREIGQGRWESALHHYLTNPCPGAFNPSPRFDERDYATRFTAIARAIADGGFRNGFDHFLRHGRAEGRYYVPSVPEPPLGARLGLRSRVYEAVTFLPPAADPRSPTGWSFGVQNAAGQPLGEFGHPRMAMRTGNENPARLAGTFIYGGVLIDHFGHFLTDGLASLWYLRMRPDLPVLWNRAVHPIPHTLWPDWSGQLWDLLGLNQHRHLMIESPITVERLIVPDPGLGNGFVHDRQARALAMRRCPNPPTGAKVWLSRSALPGQVRPPGWRAGGRGDPGGARLADPAARSHDRGTTGRCLRHGLGRGGLAGLGVSHRAVVRQSARATDPGQPARPGANLLRRGGAYHAAGSVLYRTGTATIRGLRSRCELRAGGSGGTRRRRARGGGSLTQQQGGRA